MKKERGHRPLTQTAKRRAKELEMWDQIRRTEEELMEMGTMEHALLQDHGGGTEGFIRAVEKLNKVVV